MERSFLSRRRAVQLAGVGMLAGVLGPIRASADAGDPDDPYPLPPFDYSKLPASFRRTVVPYQGNHWPGTIIVNTLGTPALPDPRGQAGPPVWLCGRARWLPWVGLADVGRKVMWPRWTPPKQMIERSPEKAKWANGMPGGPQNPLGARALSLFQNGNDTLHRIHGTNEPLSIGKRASSGCIRMVNQDAVELYRRAPVGSRVSSWWKGSDSPTDRLRSRACRSHGMRFATS